MIGFEEQEKLLKLIGSSCKRKIEVLIIGGSAMLFYNFSKAVTKDIDLVVFSENDRRYLVSVLGKLGFRKGFVPNKNNMIEPYKMTLKDYIIDIFAGNVFRLKVSGGILGRVREKIDFSRLTVSVISPEDIIISKCMTEREGDKQDAASIINEMNVNWDIIIQECRWQSEHGDFRFSLYLHDFLDDLIHDFSIMVPEKPLKETRRLYREFMERVERK